jgi:hypothetical protein
VNEPVPSLLERRADCPLRLASLVERCMAKEPAERPASMDEVVAELQACLAELDGRPDGEATMITKSPVVKQSRRRREPVQRGRLVPSLLALLVLLLVGAVAAALLLLRDDGDPGGGNANAAGGGDALAISAITAYDPEGSGGEHDEDAPLATDGDPGTFWRTETYEDQLSLIKSGVGLVVDTADAAVSELTVSTDTPGFTAEIRAGGSPQAFEQTVSGPQTVEEETTFELDETDARYLLVWITELDGGSAHINEVTAS